MEQIAKTVVGLKTYEVKIDKKDMDNYMKFSQSHENPNLNIWAFGCSIVLIFLNLLGKQYKNDQPAEYQLRKLVESFFLMRAVKDVPTPGLNVTSLQDNEDDAGQGISMVKISNK